MTPPTSLPPMGEYSEPIPMSFASTFVLLVCYDLVKWALFRWVFA